MVDVNTDDRRVTNCALGVSASSLFLMFPALLVRRTEVSQRLTSLSSLLHKSANVAFPTAAVSLAAVAASHKDGVSEFVESDESPAPSPGVVVVFAGFNLGDDVGYVLPCKIV